MAGQMNRQNAAIVIGVLLAWRIVMAALLPLSADEAYYLLWSHHLQAGYFDHPPAIAFLIRAGTLIFGDTPLGVRLMGLPLSLLASWFVWQTAALLLKDSSPARAAQSGGGAVAGPGAKRPLDDWRATRAGASEGGGGEIPARAAQSGGGGEAKAALAAVIFNLTLMTGIEMLVATPDLPSIATVAGFLWAIAKVQSTRQGRWWLAAGIFAGLSLLSKYSMLFVGLGTAVWLLADARGRAWLRTPWPWAGGILALALFAPNLAWQAQHGWMTFAFQFGRAAHGALTARYLLEFIGAELGLVTPLILVLAAMGFWAARRPGGDRFPLFVIVGVALLYFLSHALHDRVQGNWPCFLTPALAVLAADAWGRRRWLSLAALPLAGVMLLLLYLQALFGIVPLRNDPLRRLLARDFPAAAADLAQTAPGGTVVTTDYETTALLRYYRPEMQVVQLNEPWRYDWAPPPPAAWFHKQTVYFVERRRAQSDLVGDLFGLMTGAIVHPGGYQSAMVDGPKAPTVGRVP
jgi:4-amino-4-deoxy-L-arabinose transferase-like glycosyltransferase